MDVFDLLVWDKNFPNFKHFMITKFEIVFILERSTLLTLDIII